MSDVRVLRAIASVCDSDGEMLPLSNQFRHTKCVSVRQTELLPDTNGAPFMLASSPFQCRRMEGQQWAIGRSTYSRSTES